MRARRNLLISGSIVFVIGLLICLWNRGRQESPASAFVEEACEKGAPHDEKYANGIVAFGEEAMPHLIRKLETRNSLDRKLALFLRDSAPEMIARHFEDTREAHFVREIAAEYVAKLGPKGKAAVPQLIELISHPGPYLESDRAIQALGMIGPDAKEALPALRTALPQKTPFDQVTIAGAILMIAHETNEVMQILIKVLNPVTEEHAAGNAIMILGMMGPASEPATDSLLRILSDARRDPRVRRSAASVLGTIGNNRSNVVFGLTAGLKDSDAAVQTTCAASLKKLGVDSPATAEGTGKRDAP